MPDRGLFEFRQDYQVRALQDQLSQLCMGTSGGPADNTGMEQGASEAECQPCLAGQSGHSNHTFNMPQGLYNPVTMPCQQQPRTFPTTASNPSALPSENQTLPAEAATVPGDQDMQTDHGANLQETLSKNAGMSVPGCQYVASFEVEHAYELTLPPVQRRLCFPSCHTYEHHMF